MENSYKILGYLAMLFLFYRVAVSKFVTEYRNYSKLKKNGIKTIGKIIDIKEAFDLDNVKKYKPVIEFMSLSGKIFSFTQVDSQFKKPEINTHVEIIYDGIDPSNAIINNKMSRKFVIVKLVVVAIFSIFLFTMLIKTLIDSF